MTAVHPAVDIVTRTSAVVIQDRPLVPLSSWLTDVMGRCAAIGQTVQVLAPHDARLTLPLRLALDGKDTRWVVQEPGDGYYDGFSGLPLTWDGSAFIVDREAAPRGPSGTFLREPHTDLGHHLAVSLQVVHPATHELELGGTVERLAETLAGARPASWGTAEPALSRWSPTAVTELCRRRTPHATYLVFMGPHGTDAPAFGGTVRVSRVTSGVKETISFAVALPPGASRPLDDLESLAADLARDGTLGTLVARWSPGRTDLTFPAHWCGRPLPLALAVGPAGVAEIGSARATDSGGHPIGAPDEPGMWYPFADDDPEAWQHFGDLLRTLQGTVKRP
ncbi:hypothetical protein BZB76_3242 [Actinomadura pelletieri DSM 43383]|uniref:Uncharacterized protein n=1 Tax=Actinomadura pelletieri DSM 43383 TaxID=1120940 RepID=A0A495QP19_9ACTN|nr:DUF6177 family protein [Actinomadura pelletieri]RKS74725.1 hypothetical protein BZB76_3242 [Actinomadura pelletieri DSM 43383]